MSHEYMIKAMYIDLLKKDKNFLDNEIKLQKFMDSLNFDKNKQDVSPMKVGDTITYSLPERYKPR